MSTRLRFAAPAIASTVLLVAAPSFAANWQTNVNYGGSTIMDLYVPTNVDLSPGIVVSLHYCSGKAANAHPWFQAESDKYGFIIIAPGAGGNCFDASPMRSGERDAIAKMVKYVVMQHKADATRVFAAGASSGACMTNALLAAYPDVFAGGSVLAGVPAGAWTGGNAYGWTTPANRTAQQWGDIVRNANQGFTGTRPRVQLWHGTGDNTLNYMPNFPAEVAQWTNVLGVDDADITKSDFKGSQDTWARNSYKDDSGKVVLETNVAQNAPHDLSGRGLWPDAVRFFGLDQDAPVGGSGGGGAGGAGGGVAAGGVAGGGKANGGGNANGGNVNGGAAIAGAATAGGSATTTGGTASTTGGAAQSGGAANGGAVSMGGATSGGAISSAGGSPGAGGSVSNGGATSAGSPSGTSGSPAAGSGSVPAESGGCGVARGAGGRSLGALIGLTAALGALVRRRRRTAAQA